MSGFLRFFCGQETEKGAEKGKTGSVLEAQKGSEIDSPEIFAKFRILCVFERRMSKNPRI